MTDTEHITAAALGIDPRFSVVRELGRGAAANEAAIFYRTHAQSRVLEGDSGS